MGAVVTPSVSKARLATRIVGWANPAPLRRATHTLPGAPPSDHARRLPSGLTTGQSPGPPRLSFLPLCTMVGQYEVSLVGAVTRWRSAPSGLEEKILRPPSGYCGVRRSEEK